MPLLQSGQSEVNPMMNRRKFRSSNACVSTLKSAPALLGKTTLTFNPLLDGFHQDSSTNRPYSNETNKETYFSGDGRYNMHVSLTNDLSQKSTRHACPDCSSTFTREDDLRRHVKIHSPERHRYYHCFDF